MDQEIDARAREFLAFIDRCSQEPRASATAGLVACLDDLRAFLDEIQPNIDRNAPSTSTPGERLPTLGILLARLARNPVALADGALAQLIARSILYYSGQTMLTTSGSYQRKENTCERTWCTKRIQDIFLATPPTLHSSVDGGKRTSFSNLFGVPSGRIQDQVVYQSMRNMVSMLDGFQTSFNQTLSTSQTQQRVRWLHDLSALCSPMLSDEKTCVLAEKIIGAAFEVKKAKAVSSLGSPLMASTFIKGVIRQHQNGRMNKDIMAKLWMMEPLARQSSLLVLIEAVMQGAGKPGGYQSQKDIQKHFDQSCFLSVVTGGEDNVWSVGDALFEATCQEIAELASEIMDWRFVRVCVLAIDWILYRRLSAKHIDAQPESASEFSSMILCALGLFPCNEETTTPLEALNMFLKAKEVYIYQSAGPSGLCLRQKSAFLITSAISQREGFLVLHLANTLVYMNGVKVEPMHPIVAWVTWLMLGYESGKSFEEFAMRIWKLLEDLSQACSGQISSSIGADDVSAVMYNTMEGILNDHRQVLALNPTLGADLLCAVWLCLGRPDAKPLHSMVMNMTSQNFGHQNASDVGLLVESVPLMARWRDLTSSAMFKGLALRPLDSS